jgi:polyferredoxin
VPVHGQAERAARRLGEGVLTRDAARMEIYRILADVVLTIHFAIVAFVIGGLVLVVAGNRCGWRFVNGWWFRLTHLAAIAVVVAQAWLGIVCPLTTLESWLRVQGSEAGYETSFVEHWLTRILFYDAPAWAFTAAYTLFGLAVVAAWWRFPPGRRA